ncbi:Protein of unknown function [Paenibacillus sp. UNCCL117]|uniref:DUF3231 family protein n=2 Tax=unclassified Paenibacillus TaxID=185978 RepID=UPI000889661A|nr:DUF3231 family protein [Paenibacillus sp. UNCCL117]SDC67540.1 Protein of unknown function [Paenibacillus sp. cl123]SFW23349.1 Protein of unknown function [Paenibacillus sp. UNCCL117]
MKSVLTGTEMGKLWATYIGNTMGKCMLSYYLKHIDDPEIKVALEYALDLSTTNIETIEVFFKEADFPIPIGFTDRDVDLNAPRLYIDEFYLHYLRYASKAGMSLYTIAVPLVTRRDIRDFFIKCVEETMKLQSLVAVISESKNELMNAPVIQPPERVDFVHSKKFLGSFINEGRPLQGLEIAHIFGNLNNDITSKALIIGFAQVANDKKVRTFLERGKNINQKHIELLTEKLSQDGLPSPTLKDHFVTSSTVSPFSDKLMVFHKLDMFNVKIREYANGISLNGRKDIGALFVRCQAEVMLYVEDGASLMIENAWLEKPPEAVDRSKFINK